MAKVKFISDNSDRCLRTKAAQVALDFVVGNLPENGVIGIGTGTTVEVFVNLLAESGINFDYCVSSSERSSRALQQAGLNERPLGECHHVDIYIDGIDEGLDSGITVKGGGAALAREKVIATMADTFITIADSGRRLQQLGAFALPVEILPSARTSVTKAMEQLGATPVLRSDCTTDNGNLILDCAMPDMSAPLSLEKQLNALPGVVENGIFAARKADHMAFANSQGVEWLTTAVSES